MSRLDFTTEPCHVGLGPLPPLARHVGLLVRHARSFTLAFDLYAQPAQLNLSRQPSVMLTGQGCHGSGSTRLCSVRLDRRIRFRVVGSRLRLPFAFQRADGLALPGALALV
jgi:hypothetical protein